MVPLLARQNSWDFDAHYVGWDIEQNGKQVKISLLKN